MAKKNDLACIEFAGMFKKIGNPEYPTVTGHPFAAASYPMADYELPYGMFDGQTKVSVTVTKEMLNNVLDKMASIPMTVGHNFIDRASFKDKDYGACGIGSHDPSIDGNKIKQSYTLFDDAAISAIALKEKIQLSLGFFFDIKKTGDNTAEFIDIEPNHVALVEEGRGGNNLKLIAGFRQLDSIDSNLGKPIGNKMKLKINEVEFEVADKAGAHVSAMIKENQVLKDKVAKFDGFDVEAAVAQEAKFANLLTNINPAQSYKFGEDKAKALFEALKVAHPNADLKEGMSLDFYQGFAASNGSPANGGSVEFQQAGGAGGGNLTAAQKLQAMYQSGGKSEKGDK